MVRAYPEEELARAPVVIQPRGHRIERSPRKQTAITGDLLI